MEIVKELNREGHCSKKGKPFVTNAMHNILRNPKYSGVYTYSRSASKSVDGKRNGHKYKSDDEIIKIDGAVPALVSKENFEKVQKKMNTRIHTPAKYRAKREYLLSGKIVCGKCRHNYIGNCRPERLDHPEYLSYRCNNRTK